MDISRSLTGALEVQVQPRVAVLVVKSGEGRELVDSAGIAFAKATDDHAAQLPTVTVKSANTSRRDVAAVATVMSAIPEKVREDVADLRVDRAGRVTFTLDRLDVLWGNSSQSKQKAEALKTMRPIALEDGSRNLDLSSPRRPVLT